MEIGWIGPGKLGLAMAARAVAAGYGVAAYVRDPAKAAAVTARGVAVVGLPEAAGHDTVVTCLPDDDALDAATPGLLALMRPGSLLVDTSTVSVEASVRLASRAEECRVAYLRMPVLGNPTVVGSGKATVLASGPRDRFDSVAPIFDSFCAQRYWLGDGEQARVVKLAMNLMIAVTCGMMGEAMALAGSAGIHRNLFLDILGSGPLASPFIGGKVDALKRDDMSPTFSGAQMAKDLGLAADAASEAGLPAPLTALMRAQYAALKASGEQEQDLIAVAKLAGRLMAQRSESRPAQHQESGKI